MDEKDELTQALRDGQGRLVDENKEEALRRRSQSDELQKLLELEKNQTARQRRCPKCGGTEFLSRSSQWAIIFRCQNTKCYHEWQGAMCLPQDGPDPIRDPIDKMIQDTTAPHRDPRRVYDGGNDGEG